MVASIKAINGAAPSRDAFERVLAPIEHATGMPNHCYTSGEWFLHERDSLFSRRWACLGFDSVVAPGEAQPVWFMGLPLLLTRERDGTLHVFHNVCSHRGMQLVGQHCRAKGGALSCPYHAWSYGLDGTLRATPHLGGMEQHQHPDFDRSAHGLKAVRHTVWMDMVFINLDGQAAPFEAWVAPLLDRWEAFLGTGWVAQLRRAEDVPDATIDIEANWKLAVENYCESYHLPWIHPNLNRYSKLSDHYNIEFADSFSGQGSLAYNLSDEAGTTLPVFEQWPQDRLRTAEYVSCFPNVLLGIQADHVFAMVLEPLAANRTTEHLRVFFVDDTALSADRAAGRHAVLKAWQEVFGEDIGAVEGLQRGRHSPGYSGGVFSPAMDGPTHYFHQWLARAALDDA